MFVRMSHWKCKKEFWTEDFKLFNKGAVSIMENHSGFIKAMLLGGKNTSERIASVSYTHLTLPTNREV